MITAPLSSGQAHLVPQEEVSAVAAGRNKLVLGTRKSDTLHCLRVAVPCAAGDADEAFQNPQNTQVTPSTLQNCRLLADCVHLTVHSSALPTQILMKGRIKAMYMIQGDTDRGCAVTYRGPAEALSQPCDLASTTACLNAHGEATTHITSFTATCILHT